MTKEKMCIFCDIIAGKHPQTVIEFQNTNIVIFKDIKPASDYHYLAVPKHHYEHARTLNVNQKDLSKGNSILTSRLLIHSFLFQFSRCKNNCGNYFDRKRSIWMMCRMDSIGHRLLVSVICTCMRLRQCRKWASSLDSSSSQSICGTVRYVSYCRYQNWKKQTEINGVYIFSAWLCHLQAATSRIIRTH